MCGHDPADVLMVEDVPGDALMVRESFCFGTPSMLAFLVGDILTAATAHLRINLILGLVGGGIGTLRARSRHTGLGNQPGGGPSPLTIPGR